MKRSHSAESDLGEDATSSSVFHLKAQNRSLSVEMNRYKRQLFEARKELDMIRGKSREMESLVSIIQRAWSQLDIDLSMLLDSFGETDQLADTGGNTELLFRLVHAGIELHRRDPTDTSGIPKLDVDEWSTVDEIQRAKIIAEQGVIPPPSAPTSSAQTSSSSATEATPAGNDEGAEAGEGAEPGEDTADGTGDGDRAGSSEDAMRVDTADADADAAGTANEHLSIMDNEFGATVDETLSSHASFTLSLLERLCYVLSDSGLVDHLPDSLGAIADAKGLHSEIFYLKDKMTKLSAEIIDLQSKLHISEKMRRVAERALDRATVDQAAANGTSSVPSTADAAASSAGQGASSSSGDAGNPTDGTVKGTLSSEAEAELRKRINILEKQLNESEAAKAKAEMTLTERLARPLSQTEAQVTDMRRALEDLRQQSRQRVASLITEGTALQERVADLEAAMIQLESISNAKCLEATELATKEIKRIEEEKNALQATIFSNQAEVAVTQQLRTQITELQSLEATTRQENSKLVQRVVLLTSTQEKLRSHLSNSRKRELELEQRLGIEHKPQEGEDIIDISGEGENGQDIVKTEPHSSASASGTDAAESKIGDEKEKEPPHIADIGKMTLAQAQARAKEAQIELDDARASLNDLIMEIESVSAEEVKAREQCARVLRQMNDGQSMQRGVLEENFRLHDQIAELQKKQGEVDGRIDVLQNAMKQQDAIISQLRAAEQAVRNEIVALKKSGAEETSKRHLNEQLLMEAEQKIKLAEHTVEIAKKRNVELQARCDELSAQCQEERKLRMEAQRELKPKAPKKEKSAAKDDSKGGEGESAMLDMCLDMLRCSVCKDRFKSVAITRCLHMFCKECIDENLRNRHRKCPACAEKFGQDDVRPVFFK